MSSDQPLSRRRHGQLAVFHPLHAHECIRNLSDLSPFPFDHQDLQAMVMIQMYMHPGHNMALKVMLDMREFSGQIRNVMIIDERDRPDGVLILIPLLADQIVTDEIPERLRACRVFSTSNDVVEVLEQAMIQ